VTSGGKAERNERAHTPFIPAQAGIQFFLVKIFALWLWVPAFAGTNGRLMREIVRTNDMVLISAVGSLLDGAGIRHLVFDQNMSVLEGSLGMLPRRILVAENDAAAARRLLTDAGLAHELRPQESQDER
jgi:hypothetical protein